MPTRDGWRTSREAPTPVGGYTEWPEAGGLLTYDVDVVPLFNRAAVFKGAKPADLPVEQPTKFELRVDLDAIEGLPEPARRRLFALAAHRLDGEGRLVVTSQVTRIQSHNLEDARGKVRELVAAALIRPRARRDTRPTRTSRERRIAGKKQQSVTKRLRSKPTRWS